jgi:hypothetical protein
LGDAQARDLSRTERKRKFVAGVRDIAVAGLGKGADVFF